MPLPLPPKLEAVNLDLIVQDLKARVISKRVVDLVIQRAGADWAYVDGLAPEVGTQLECWGARAWPGSSVYQSRRRRPPSEA